MLFNNTLFAWFLVQPKITFLDNQTASELEEQVTLTCEASGDPTPTISWSFGRRVFTEGVQVLRSNTDEDGTENVRFLCIFMSS